MFQNCFVYIYFQDLSENKQKQTKSQKDSTNVGLSLVND